MVEVYIQTIFRGKLGHVDTSELMFSQQDKLLSVLVFYLKIKEILPIV